MSTTPTQTQGHMEELAPERQAGFLKDQQHGLFKRQTHLGSREQTEAEGTVASGLFPSEDKWRVLGWD